MTPTEQKPLDCPVCGAMKSPYNEYCKDCEIHKKVKESQSRQRSRDDKWGKLYD